MPRWFRLSAMTLPQGRKISPFDTSYLDGGIARRTMGGAAIALGSSALMFMLQVAQLAVLSRLLTPEDFGLVGMAMVVTMFIQLFSDVGLPMATVQRDKINQPFVTAVFYIDLLVSIGLMAVCMAIAPVAASVFGDPRVAGLMIFIAVTFPLIALRGQHQALLTRRMEFLRLNLVNVSANTIGAATAIGCAWLAGLGYWSIAIGMVTTALATMVLSWVAMPWIPSRPGSLAAGRSAIGFGLNLLGAHLAGWLWKQADRALIGWRWNASELGYYTRAYSVLMVPIGLISGPIGSAIIPALSRVQNDEGKRTALIVSTARAFAFLSGLLTLGLLFNTDFIVTLILGAQWDRSIAIFSFLALSLIPSLIWEHARIVFISLGRTDTMRRYAVIAAIVHVACFAVGVQWGAIGVAVGLAAASALVTPPLLVVSSRVAKLRAGTLIAQFAPSLAITLGVGALTYFAQPIFANEEPIAEAATKSAAIITAFLLAHAAIIPFHAGWRSDLRRIWGVAQEFVRRKRVL